VGLVLSVDMVLLKDSVNERQRVAMRYSEDVAVSYTVSFGVTRFRVVCFVVTANGAMGRRGTYLSRPEPIRVLQFILWRCKRYNAFQSKLLSPAMYRRICGCFSTSLAPDTSKNLRVMYDIVRTSYNGEVRKDGASEVSSRYKRTGLTFEGRS
jgi:hypothetical protein